MACSISFMELLAVATSFRASLVRVSACLALAALLWVMEAISSRDADVSSRAAACSEAPSASI